MNPRQLIGLAGAGTLLVGVFSPLISMPFMGTINYFNNGKGDGTLVLVLAAISVALVLARQFKWLWLTGLGSLGVTAMSFFNFQRSMSEMQQKMNDQLAGNPFRGFADIAMQSVQLQWGWALLVLGAGLLLASAGMKEEVSVIREK